jgi:rubrerythrin
MNDARLIERALISECAADDTYQEILEATTSARVQEVVREIQKDEQNHMGRLTALLIELRGGRYSVFAGNFTAGLNQED